MTHLFSLTAALCLSIISTAPAVADDAAVRMVEPIITLQPRMVAEQFGAPGLFMPEIAARGRRPVSGTAVIQCTLAATGVLTGCKVISEMPPKYNFGYAALHMAEVRVLTAAPRIVDGQPVGGEVVRLAIEFGHPRH